MLMFRKTLLYFLFILTFSGVSAQNKFTISGYISEKGSKENLPGVTVYVPKLKVGTTSNNYGFFSITLPKDSVEIIFSYVGFKAQKLNLYLDKSLSMNIEL